MTYYQILGIPQSATLPEIKRAYYSLAKLYHPDRNPSHIAEEKLRVVNQAYDILSDLDKRRDYDQELQRQRTLTQTQVQQRSLQRSLQPKPKPKSKPKPKTKKIKIGEMVEQALDNLKVGMRVGGYCADKLSEFLEEFEL